MTQITRTFDSAAQAKAAIAELKQRGFQRVELIDAADRRGGAAVRVEPPFGSALAATAILDRHSGKQAIAAPATPAPPAQAEVQPAREPARPVAAPAAPAPLPARREELRTGPRTVSEWLGIPVLIDSDTFFSGFPLLLRSSRKAPAAKSE
ncbi:hypothetical protein [Rhodopseudomonas sp. BR0M22]|uniref:hypothetical protein n=1 Tax=Rhodopseudomonas sp. BR0M22 TaxID=2269369 RepID=UPI0013DF1E08|nr:hypothetical protein [Rhodopseudomonas sp. BR0M22]NEW91801.1 hypothetical protein [Rhodopseudomonas sp. BR0M22]